MLTRDLRWVILGVLGLTFCHGIGLYARFERDTSTLKNGFMYDHILMQHSLVLTQHCKIGGLPLTPEQRWTRLLPVDMPGESGIELLDTVWRNRPQSEDVYRNQLPVGYVLGSVPSILFGPSYWTLRFGLLFPFALLLFWIWDIGRRLHGQTAGFYAAVIVGLLPCVWQSLVLSKIVLSNMTLVTGVLWSLLLVTQAGYWLAAVALAFLIVLGTRSGEYVSDGLLTMAAVLPVIALQSGALVWRSYCDKSTARLLPLGGAIVGAAAGIDWIWLSSHGGSYVVAEAGLEQSGFLWTQWFFNLQSYLWLFQHSLFLPVGSMLVGLGLLIVWKAPIRVFSIALGISAVIGVMALSIPNKIQDYYMMPFIPAMVILTGIGLAELKNKGRLVFGFGALTLFLSYCHGMFSPSSDNPFWRTLDPALTQSPDTSAQAWFADWRRQEVKRQGNLRQSLSTWLQEDQSSWISKMPEASVVVIPWNTGNQTYDGVATLLMSLRPDILVMNVDLSKTDPVTAAILSQVNDSYWIIVSQDAHFGLDSLLKNWGGQLISSHPELGLKQLSIYKLQASESL
ncbi:MAG: ArnT family glycosyltransferase [Myxococcota bacterium]